MPEVHDLPRPTIAELGELIKNEQVEAIIIDSHYLIPGSELNRLRHSLYPEANPVRILARLRNRSLPLDPCGGSEIRPGD